MELVRFLSPRLPLDDPKSIPVPELVPVPALEPAPVSDLMSAPVSALVAFVDLVRGHVDAPLANPVQLESQQVPLGLPDSSA